MKWRACVDLSHVGRSFEAFVDELSGVEDESLRILDEPWGVGAVVIRPHLGSRIPEVKERDFRSAAAVRAWLRSTETLLAGIVVPHHAKRAYLFRDAFGRLPLSYTPQNSRLTVGTPAGSLVEDPVPNREVLASFAGFGRSVDERDFFEKVFRVRAGELVVVSPNGTRESHLPLWGSPYKARLKPRVQSDVYDRLREFLTRGFDTFPSPVALSLSSGVDSSTLYRLLNSKHKVETFTMVAPGYAFDESARVREDLRDNPPHRAFEFDLTQYPPSTDPASGWPTVIDPLDGPSPHPGASYELAFRKFIGKRHRILISGVGADQLFAWDPTSWLLDVARNHPPLQILSAWANLGLHRRRVTRTLLRDLPAARLASKTVAWRVLRRLTPAFQGADPWRQAFRWVQHDGSTLGYASGIGQYLRHDNELFQRRLYRMEHRSGVALYLPFLQHSLWEWLGHAPSQVRRTKQILRSFAQSLGCTRAHHQKIGTFDNFIEDAVFVDVEEFISVFKDIDDMGFSLPEFTRVFRAAHQHWLEDRGPVVGVGAVWRTISAFDWLRKASNVLGDV